MVGVGGGAPGDPSDDPMKISILEMLSLATREVTRVREFELVMQTSKLTEFTGGVIQYDFGKIVRKENLL